MASQMVLMKITPTDEHGPGWLLLTGAQAACLMVGTSVTTLIAAYVMLLWVHGPFGPSPPLVADLPEAHDLIGPEFRRRVQAQFLVGSAEGDLIAELERQGFLPKWGNRGSQIAHYYLGAFVCADEFYVYWTANSDGRLTEVSGVVRSVCL